MNLPKPEGIENWTQQQALGHQLDSLRKSVSAAKAQSAARPRVRTKITEPRVVDSSATASLATPARRQLLEQWKAEKKCATPKRIAAPPSTPDQRVSTARPSTPVLHKNQKLIKLHIKSIATSAAARDELAAMTDSTAEEWAKPIIVAMPEYWIARARVEQRDKQWVRALEMLVIGHNRKAEPVVPLRSEASAVLRSMTAWVAEERSSIVAARDANDKPTFLARKRTLQATAGALQRFLTHPFCSPVLRKETQAVIEAICTSLPPRAVAKPTAPAAVVTATAAPTTVTTTAPPTATVEAVPEKVFITAEELATALADSLKIAEAQKPASPAARYSASPADSPLTCPSPMDEEDWRSPEGALAEESEEVEQTFKPQARKRPEITPSRFSPQPIAPEVYTSKLATPVTKRGVPIMSDADFKSPEPPKECEAEEEMPATPININAGKVVRKRRSLVLKSPGTNFSAVPERVPASDEFLKARAEEKQRREAKATRAAPEQVYDDMSCYEHFDDMDEGEAACPEQAKAAFGKLPQSFPVARIPVAVKPEKIQEPVAMKKELQGSLVVITPAKTTRKEKEALGSERKLAAVRRSSRFLSSAAQEEHPELKDVEKAEEFDKVLAEYDYIYTPNPKLLTRKRPTQMLLTEQMAALSLNSSPAPDTAAETEKDEESLQELDPMMQEDETVEQVEEEPVTPSLPITAEEVESGRRQEVVRVATRSHTKKTCLTPVVRSTRLAQKRL
eukprot:CAMPEP_0114624414 /NCGR_PEP_ID=MMETSP0168-20121206/10754_1 /TAXON_ID=95228 ORGANISM="Vannella sp., Strain DIVA3 517/6/12" /NCGR_SAMPLE_ID=MMETSP0168 /ASSEMBLY_ACC=CAM_ASM_000044 /LENGTH=735 /DNA_ID=CAMNT_0001835687 /DNA_START=32 /DNA_END=2236 /DNA_ORIENTATION=+